MQFTYRIDTHVIGNDSIKEFVHKSMELPWSNQHVLTNDDLRIEIQRMVHAILEFDTIRQIKATANSYTAMWSLKELPYMDASTFAYSRSHMRPQICKILPRLSSKTICYESCSSMQ